MRVLIIEGSSSPPTFVRNFILSLNRRPEIDLAVLAKDSAAKHLPGVRVLANDFSVLSFCRMLLHLGLRTILNLRGARLALKLTTPSENKRVFLKRLYRTILILDYNPSIIHFQWAAHIASYSNLLLSQRFKCVISLRGNQINVRPVLYGELRSLYQQLFPLCYFHAVSNAIKMKATLYGALEDRIRVIYSPVPSVFFESYEEKFIVDRELPKILSLGRFHWIKGYGYAIEAIRILRDRGVRVHYTIVANGELPDELRYQIKDRRLEEQITVLDGVPYAKVPLLMKAHCVLLLPSIEEGLANVVAESMAIGLPVVSTNCGGMREVVIEGESGWLAPIRDAAGIADALERALSATVNETMAIRQRARQIAETRFELDRNIQSFSAMYQEIARMRG